MNIARTTAVIAGLATGLAIGATATGRAKNDASEQQNLKIAGFTGLGAMYVGVQGARGFSHWSSLVGTAGVTAGMGAASLGAGLLAGSLLGSI